jgi:hypothetical protein
VDGLSRWASASRSRADNPNGDAVRASCGLPFLFGEECGKRHERRPLGGGSPKNNRPDLLDRVELLRGLRSPLKKV